MAAGRLSMTTDSEPRVSTIRW